MTNSDSNTAPAIAATITPALRMEGVSRFEDWDIDIYPSNGKVSTQFCDLNDAVATGWEAAPDQGRMFPTIDTITHKGVTYNITRTEWFGGNRVMISHTACGKEIYWR